MVKRRIRAAMSALDELMDVIKRHKWPMPGDRAEVRRVLCRLAADPNRKPADGRFTLESILSALLIAEKIGDLPPRARNIVRLTRSAIAQTMVN